MANIELIKNPSFQPNIKNIAARITLTNGPIIAIVTISVVFSSLKELEITRFLWIGSIKIWLTAAKINFPFDTIATKIPNSGPM